ERARLAISERYLSRDDNPDLDPSRQDQLDKNRIPGQFGEGQLAPSPEFRARNAERSEDTAGGVTGNFAQALQKSLGDQPYVTLALAGLAGFVLGALWKS